MTLAGHSQGARIAVALAHSNKHITQLGLFGYNPMRRIDQLVWNYRKQAQNGEITWEQADSFQQRQYQFCDEIQNEDSVAVHPSLIAWCSFSTSSISELTSLKIPVYIAFGSEDPVAEYCDLLPLYFIEKGKTNYQLKRYAHVEHNFFPLHDEGIPDYSNGKWIEVMNAFLAWSDAQ